MTLHKGKAKQKKSFSSIPLLISTGKNVYLSDFFWCCKLSIIQILSIAHIAKAVGVLKIWTCTPRKTLSYRLLSPHINPAPSTDIRDEWDKSRRYGVGSEDQK